ncbi:hypothetical protein BDM02DRAFT_1629740 [Thelephora ganbajun]|uniref:Uncharacterized protein n=1 Tax=Thelephora ganbajun TaxID=370292 RepID=A0ACB6ZW65_THEGA|nr:hypothetical protein BDM02DRAFT_1629740 [Thelephora ganbajun]
MPDQFLGQIRVGLGQPGSSSSMAAKRPFQDLDAGNEEIQDSSPGRSSASDTSPNKRARSEGSPSTDAGSSSNSNTLTGSSSSSSHNPIQPPTEFDVVPAEAIPDSRPPPPTLPSPTHLLTTSSHLPMPTRSPLVDMHHLPMVPVPYPSTSIQSTLPHPPVPSTSTNSFEATLQRAHDFELQIAAIREDISHPGTLSTEHFPPTESSRHSHPPIVSRVSHDSDLPSVEQFLTDIRNRSPPLSGNAIQTFAARLSISDVAYLYPSQFSANARQKNSIPGHTPTTFVRALRLPRGPLMKLALTTKYGGKGNRVEVEENCMICSREGRESRLQGG